MLCPLERLLRDAVRSVLGLPYQRKIHRVTIFPLKKIVERKKVIASLPVLMEKVGFGGKKGKYFCSQEFGRKAVKAMLRKRAAESFTAPMFTPSSEKLYVYLPSHAFRWSLRFVSLSSQVCLPGSRRKDGGSKGILVTAAAA